MDGVLESESSYWQDLSDSNKYKHLFEIACLVDCKFLVGPDEETAEIIQGHRIMFVMASPVFEKMFTGEYVEANKQSVIHINDAYPHDFKNFRYLMYTDPSKLSNFRVDEIIAIHRLCDKYLISSIAKQCILHLKGLLINSNPDETIKIYKFAFGLVNKSFLNDIHNTTLKSKSMLPDYKLCELSPTEFYEYMTIRVTKEQAPILFSTVNFYLTHFFELEPDHFNETLDESKLSTDSTKKNNKKYEIIRSKLINLINLKSMTAGSFIEGPGNSRFLSAEEKYAILSVIVKSGNSFF